MHYSYLNLDDTSCNLGGWEAILDDYNDLVSGDDIWQIARVSETLPHFGNLYQSLVISRLVSRFCAELDIEEDSELVTFFCYINAVDTHLHINDTQICDKQDWYRVMDEVREEILAREKLAA